MHRLVLPAAVVVTGVLGAFATAQAPDSIVVDGKLYYLYSNPLEQLYEKQKRPEFVATPEGSSSGNWRGYFAFWQIEGRKLYLIGIDTYVGKKKMSLRELFAGRVKKGRVFADWFTGDLRIPLGELLQDVNMGYGSTFERDIVYTVQNGKVLSRHVIDNTKKPLPDEYKKGLKELKKLDEWEKKTKW